MSFGGFVGQNNAQQLTGGNCIFSYDPMNGGTYNAAGIPGISTSPLGVSIGFNGSSQYLTYNPTFLNGTTTSVTFGTNSFTVEAWIYAGSIASTNKTLLDARSGATNNWAWYVNQTTGTVSWIYNNTLVLTSTNAVSVNMWTHVAYVRNGTTGTMYVNGVVSGSTTDSANYTYTPSLVAIGASYTGTSTYFNGQMTNIRISNGTAVYTAAFTPPTQPLTSGGSSLCLLALTSSTFLTDSSPNGYTMTNNGTIVYNTNTPFQVTPGSIYFDGSSYLYANATQTGSTFAFGTNPFTVEYWVYANANATGSAQHVSDFRNGNVSNPAYADYIVNSSGNIQVNGFNGGGVVNIVASNVALNNNSWNHVAWGRTSGGNVNIWVNGVLSGTVAANINQATSSLTLGSQNIPGGAGFYLKGYLAQFRVSNTQVYTSNNFGAPAYLGVTANTLYLLNTYTAGAAAKDSSVNSISASITGNNIFGGQNYGPYANAMGDLSGQQNTGILSYAVGNSAPIWYSNKDGYWALTGGNTNQQQILTSNQVLAAPGSVGNAGSVGAWIQLSTATSVKLNPIASFIDTKSGNAGGNWGPLLWVNNANGVSFAQYDSGNTTPTGKLASGSGNVVDGNWHYVVGTISAGGNISLYVDGALASSAPWVSGGGFSGFWRFGGTSNIGGSAWNLGNLVDPFTYTAVNFGPIHAYSTALTANQVAQNYNLAKARFTNTGSANYSYTGGIQQFQVPSGVTQINATVTGAQGGKPISSFGNVGNASGTSGGAAAAISGTIPVNPGQVLYLVVGRGGQDYSYFSTSAAGNVYIGGPGGAGSTVAANTQIYGGNGAAGGGFSGIFNSATPTQFSAIMIAGGGGGGSGWNGYNASGGNAANSFSNVATAGLNNPGILPQWGGAPIANISGNGTVVTVNFSATITGNVNGTLQNFTPYFQGQPVSLYGATSPFASVTGYVLTASPTQITYYSTATGTQSPAGAYVWSQGLTAGSGGAPAYPGGFGYIFDYGVNNTWGNSGVALAGGSGSSTFNSTWTGGGGGGGGYYGGGGGSSGGAAVGGGGGGSNYINPIVTSPTFLSLTGTNSNLTAVHGSIRLTW